MSKETIIHDEVKFQHACSRFVERNVLYCLSCLMYDVGQNLEASAKIFDFDFDDGLDWFGQDDWEEPARDAGWDEVKGEIVKRPKFVDGRAKRDQYDMGDLIDWLRTEPGYAVEEVEDQDDAYQGYKDAVPVGQVCTDEDDAWKELIGAEFEALKARYEEEHQETADDWQDACSQDRLEPYSREVFEHWLVDSWFAGQLKERGEVVFEFCNMNIWGRTTTGQAISMDGLIRGMVRDLPDYSYVWED